MSKLYTVIYNGSDIYNHKMTINEKFIIENFRGELINICNSLNIERGRCFDGSPYMGRLRENDEFTLRYKSDIGYYVLDGERGVYNLRKGFPTKNREEAKFNLLKTEFENAGFTYELNNRKVFEREWSEKYINKYDSRKIAFEYTLRMLSHCFDNLLEGVIEEFTKYMNIHFDKKLWQLNHDSLEFEEK